MLTRLLLPLLVLPLLAADYFRKHGIDELGELLSPNALSSLAAYPWPGNLAEFRAAMGELVEEFHRKGTGPLRPARRGA